MLIKQKDDSQAALQTLDEFLALKTLAGQQRELIEEEIEKIRAGAKGEKEAAYHIDFRLKNSKNWMVIHDLRLEHNGRVAQIDHLLIDRRFDVFVIESKNLKTAVRVNANDEFEVKTRWGWKGMASPVGQNKRHIDVLGELIRDGKFMPSRLGFQIRPKFYNWVLVAPECTLARGEQKEATILKMDMFDKGLEQFINQNSLSDALSMAKLCSAETVTAFAEKLVGFHKPIVFDYAAKFGITDGQRYQPPVDHRNPKVGPVSKGSSLTIPKEAHCQACQTPVEPRVVAFCEANERRLRGKVLCRTCQVTPQHSVEETKTVAASPPAQCERCSIPVDSKVVAFCRFNSRRFGKKVLCRTCQVTAAIPAV